MRILILQDDLYDYLRHLVKGYAAAGIDPQEGLALYHLHNAIGAAQTVDDSQSAKIKTGEVGDAPVASVEVVQQQ